MRGGGCDSQFEYKDAKMYICIVFLLYILIESRLLAKSSYYKASSRIILGEIFIAINSWKSSLAA